MKLKLLLIASLVLASGVPAAWPAGDAGLKRAPEPAPEPIAEPTSRLSADQEPLSRLEGPVHLSDEVSDAVAGPARAYAFRATGRALANTPDHRKIAVHTVSLFYFG